MQIEAVAQIVSSYLKKNHVRANEVSDLIAETHKALAGLGAPEAEPQPKALVAPMSVRKAVSDNQIISFEDGKAYKSLKRHLSVRGLTPNEYREKWGLPADFPMTAPGYSKTRSELARKLGLGQSRAKARQAAADAKGEAEAAAKPKRRTAKRKADATAD